MTSQTCSYLLGNIDFPFLHSLLQNHIQFCITLSSISPAKSHLHQFQSDLYGIFTYPRAIQLT